MEQEDKFCCVVKDNSDLWTKNIEIKGIRKWPDNCQTGHFSGSYKLSRLKSYNDLELKRVLAKNKNCLFKHYFHGI